MSNECENDTEGGSGAAWKAPAVGADVNARGSEIGGDLRAWATQRREEANAEFWTKETFRDIRGRDRAYGKMKAFDEVIAWAIARKADAAT